VENGGKLVEIGQKVVENGRLWWRSTLVRNENSG
jgi:hypothetical protein